MRNRWKRRLSALMCVWVLAVLLPATASASAHDPTKETGEQTYVGEQTPFSYDGVHYEGATEFYMHIQNKAGVTEQNMPKTGDSGVPIELLLTAALLCGGGYLICCDLEKKHD